VGIGTGSAGHGAAGGRSSTSTALHGSIVVRRLRQQLQRAGPTSGRPAARNAYFGLWTRISPKLQVHRLGPRWLYTDRAPREGEEHAELHHEHPVQRHETWQRAARPPQPRRSGAARRQDPQQLRAAGRGAADGRRRRALVARRWHWGAQHGRGRDGGRTGRRRGGRGCGCGQAVSTVP
jgi:hypothetical protein